MYERRMGISRVAIAAVCLMLVSAAPRAALAQAEKLPKAEDVLKKCVEATGGQAAMEKIHNRLSKGKVQLSSMEIQATFTSYAAAPNKLHITIDVENADKTERGTDGTTCWQTGANAEPKLIENDEKAMRQRLWTFNLIAHWRKLYKKAETAGRETWHEQPCLKLTMTPKTGGSEEWLINEQTNLLVGIHVTATQPNDEFYFGFEDYRKVDGVMVPYKVIESSKSSAVELTYVAESVEHNVTLPKNCFAVPESIKALVKKPAREPARPNEPEKTRRGTRP